MSNTISLDTLSLDTGPSIYYQSEGVGTTIILIPGWNYSSEVFVNNIPNLAKRFRVISYDPRSHGRSEVTKRGNNYVQHGKDLHDLLSKLAVNEEVILLGWSLGVHIAYSYIEQFGIDKVKALICVDESPKIIKTNETDWAEGSQEEIDGLLQIVDSDAYLGFFADYMKEGFVQAPNQDLIDRFTKNASSVTPTMAAELLKSSTQRDYTAIAIEAASKVPVLNIIREDWSKEATKWIQENQPRSSIQVLGKHLMLYEFADEFNQCVNNFFNSNNIS